MQQLKVGQRFRVFEILPGNTFATIKGQTIKVGQHRVENFDRPNIGGVLIDTKYGNCYHWPVETQLKHVGTLIITRVKERNHD